LPISRAGSDVASMSASGCGTQRAASGGTPPAADLRCTLRQRNSLAVSPPVVPRRTGVAEQDTGATQRVVRATLRGAGSLHGGVPEPAEVAGREVRDVDVSVRAIGSW